MLIARPLSIIPSLLIASALTALGCSDHRQDVSDTGQALEGDGTQNGSFTFPTTLPLTVLYTGEDGKTHFREDAIPMTPGTSPIGEPSANSPTYTTTNARVVMHAPNFGCTHDQPHNVTSKRFLTILNGKFEVTATDGDKRLLKKGDIAQLLDIAPSEGHLGCAKGSEPLVMMFTNLP